jgi:5-methylcytosine-specific restriction endonuclease McrA
MAITDRTRKILWVKAGGRCSICQVQLVTEGTDTDDPSVFGEEAHIVGQSPNGPRAGNVPDVDSYANLILLCRKDHKRVDDQVGKYTVERLKEIKRQHEEWVASLGETANPDSVRLIPDPARPPKEMLKLIISGTELWHFVNGACSCNPAWPTGLSDENEDLIATFFDNVGDWNNCSGDLSFTEQRHACRSLNENIEELAKAGFVIWARERFLLLTGGVNREPWPWRAVDIVVRPFDLTHLVDAEGKPIDLDRVRLVDAEGKPIDLDQIISKFTDVDA